MNSHFAIACLLFASFSTELASAQSAARCDPSYCRLPNCYCGGTDVPGGYSREDIPQFVLLTFDDAVNSLNQQFFKELFNNRRNPNGCPIKSTFYISHEWTDYSQVQDLYAGGHEIASHTVTHSDGKGFDDVKWADEVIGMAEMLVRYAGVKPQDIKGMRAPFLQVGGDAMFSTLKRYGLNYDSSMSTTGSGWPYTLEYQMPHSCAVHPCPEQSHPGMWEIPMPTLKDIRGGSCAMADGCYYEEDGESIQKIFTQNFLDHYTKEKTPFPLFFHSAWFFNRPHRKEAFFKFIDSILALPDVYFVTSSELINWMQNPQPVNAVANSNVFGCDFQDRPKRCHRRNTKKCNLKFRGDVRQWASCQTKTCPRQYPWVNNLTGN